MLENDEGEASRPLCDAKLCGNGHRLAARLAFQKLLVRKRERQYRIEFGPRRNIPGLLRLHGGRGQQRNRKRTDFPPHDRLL